MMVMTKKPYGAVSELSIIGVRVRDGKHYIVDKGYNKYEIDENEYKRCIEKGIKVL